MGVKSTRVLSRPAAIERATDMYLNSMRRAVEARFTAMTDTDLENALELMNDADRGGEGYENYLIGDATP